MEKFAKKLALEHNIQGKVSKKFYPIIELKKDMEVISKSYDVLQESIILDVPIPPSGEWILDNYYILEEQYNVLKKELKINEYMHLPAVNQIARIYEVSKALVEFADGNVNRDNIECFINAYNTKRKISMQEIWILPVMLKISLIHHIKNVAEKIISSQYQKFKVASLVERIIKGKNYSEQIFSKYRTINLYGEISSYVEYMVYLLKREGKSAEKYLNLLSDEIEKAGTDLDDIIKVEHYDMALRRVSVSNSITSIKNILRYNWSEIFEKINGIEEILLNDMWYAKSDFDTKNMYRTEIQSIGKKTKLSENYIATKLIELGKQENKHIGEYLIGDSKKQFYNFLGYKYPKEKSINQKLFMYLSSIYIPAIVISIIFTREYFIFALIPLSEVFVLLANRIIGKIKKPKLLPKLEEIPDDVKTMVIVPTLINSEERTIKVIKNLEIFFLANNLPNIYFALLGDASEEDDEHKEIDDKIKETGINEIKKLNDKYGEERFFFLYRKRVFNKTQNKWLGYERKRGMITEFVDFLINGNNGTFCVNTIKVIPKIKYIITLDSDTVLPIDSAKRLIGTMEHPLNAPVISGKTVVRGYGLIQPKVGISMKSATATIFSKLFAGAGGIDAYSTAESNVYQDLFGEAIFTGKGIFNIEIFHKLLKSEIPENRVLSHDLLEGCYLRCGLATDIEVIDDFPQTFNQYMIRQSRWTRGDWQIAKWIYNSPLNNLSRYKIFDNLRRSLVDVFLSSIFFTEVRLLGILIIFAPFFFDLIEKIFNHKIGIRLKNYIPIINGLLGSFMRCLLNLVFLPYKAFLALKAISITLYRIIISRKNLLEWTTAADSERLDDKSLKTCFLKMYVSPLKGLTIILLNNGYFFTNLILFLLWSTAPFINFFVSVARETLTEKTLCFKENFEDVAKKTWNYFEDFMNEKNNFLPPDNYQLGRKNKITLITSSTNIGLGLLSIISAYDLKFISKDDCIFKLKKSIDTISKLEKWNGHLYNWYNISTLEPLNPRFISTVDSGNYVGYLYVVKEFLTKVDEIEYASVVNLFIVETDFSKLYDFSKNLFSVGFDVRENKLVDSYYDLLASESRLASFVAICKKDVPYKHWFNLGRSLTSIDRYKGLVSWSGTMFEYFMPLIIMNTQKYTLIDESYDFCIYSQKKYAKKLNIPWGISESAFNLQDLNSNYQYKAFGIPWLGLKRGLKDEVVVAPYSTVLSLNYSSDGVYKNLERLKELGAYDEYGFFDAIDFTPNRVGKEGHEVVKTYMAHHQALILISINNYLNDFIMQKRFIANPEIKSADILLQERVPTDVVMTKNKKEKIKVLQYKGYDENIEKSIEKCEGNVNIQSGKDYTLLINDFGEGYSLFDGKLITKYNEKIRQGNCIFIKNVETGKTISNTPYPIYDKNDEYEVKFSPSYSIFYRKSSDFEVTTKIGVSSEENLEVRELTIKNNSTNELKLELISYVEPVITNKNNDIVHPAYNNLFFRAKEYEKSIILEKKMHNDNLFYLNFVSEIDNKFEFELDKSKVIGRLRNTMNPLIASQDVAFSNECMVSTNTVISYKNNLNLEANESKKIIYYYGIGRNLEEVKSMYDKYKEGDASRIFEMAYSKNLVENRFLGYTGKNIMLYNKLFAAIQSNDTKQKYIYMINENTLKQSNLWRFGVSGDLPIVLARINKVNNIYVVKDLMMAIEYFGKKGLYVDLIILNDEENKYEQFVQDKIYETLNKKGLNYLLNSNGGIHVIKKNDISTEEEELIMSCSDMIINSNDGFLNDQINS